MARQIAPLVGVSLAVVWDAASTADGKPLAAGRVTILAASANSGGYGQAHNLGAGYQALVRLISLAHRQLGADHQPYVYGSQLAQAAQHDPVLHIVVGTETDVGVLVAQRQYTPGRSRLRLWKQALPRSEGRR